MTTHRVRLVKAAILLVFLGILLFVYENTLDDYLTPPLVRRFLLSYGDLAPLVFFVLFTLRPLVLVPGSVLAVAGGLLFGPLWGTLYTVLGSTAGALLAYFVSRSLGRDFVANLLQGRLETVGKSLREGGWQVVLLLRLTPFLAADVVSYGAGLCGVGLAPYFWGTFFGAFPSALLLAYLGNSLKDPFAPETLALAAGYLALFGALWGYRRFRNHM